MKTPVKDAASAANAAAYQLEMELVQFRLGDQSIQFNIDLTAETVWATQQQIADLYEKSRPTIVGHVQNIFSEGELVEASVSQVFRQTAADGKSYDVTHYNLDMILSVGYRVSGPKATKFRQWATATLRSYIVDGYALNERRLKDAPHNLAKLAADVRALRADEKNIYASVRDCFKVGSSDYDAQSPACRSFYARLQDKFHFAVTGKTASQIILDRAKHTEPNMGIQAFEGNRPTIDEAKIGKNYLDGEELYRLHILCEQFLLFVESAALRGRQLTMGQLEQKFDSLMVMSDYPVFQGYKDFLRERAVKHAQAEYARWLVRLKQDDVVRIPRARS
ncbi:RhuM family protein [Bosea sp. PAMC 26642]|uniref:RhuM family protein n=1 Tax=Bosea sp. (strain PAMC 26642) TaxID=1792307 RepID=UPI0007701435|nr:RhuM family protein [Bosea sp. PAMC 26642]AMJ60953.1 hypothetical protein AXW83_12185 [Bosea sp. PAMC 26642]